MRSIGDWLVKELKASPRSGHWAMATDSPMQSGQLLDRPATTTFGYGARCPVQGSSYTAQYTGRSHCVQKLVSEPGCMLYPPLQTHQFFACSFSTF